MEKVNEMVIAPQVTEQKLQEKNTQSVTTEDDADVLTALEKELVNRRVVAYTDIF